MKNHLKIAIAAVGVSCAVLLSGCAGCNNVNRNLAYLSSNWYANTSYKKIQPAFTENNANFKGERITYTVTHDPESAVNENYSVSYGEGATYVTEFYATAFDKEQYAHSDFKEGYPQTAPVVYRYSTVLTIPQVTFKYGDEERTFTDDKVETVCYFLPVENQLRPLYSYQKIKSVTPAKLSVTNIEEAYEEHDCEYVTYYSYDGAQAKTLIREGGQEKERNVSELDRAPNSVFDTAALDIVVRASKLDTSLAQTVNLYTPAGGLGLYGFTGRDLALPEAEAAAVKDKLNNAGLYMPEYDEENNEKPLQTAAVSVSYGGGLGGASQIYWFAAVSNPRNNTGRATLLKISVPLSFGLGVLNYVLDTVDSTLL